MSVFASKLLKRVNNFTLALILAMSTLTASVPFLFADTAKAVGITNTTVANLASTVATADADDIIQITDSGTITSTINVDKSLTIKGTSGSTITTSGDNSVFLITAPNSTISNLSFVKTDDTGIQNIIGIQSTNARVWQNSFAGGFDIGEDGVSRAVAVSPGANGFDIRNNTVSRLRQPAYIDASTGVILSNYVEKTKGWVLVADANVSFTNNTWGTGSSRNVNDIAIIPAPTNNYPDTKIVQISDQNNDAVIENQFGGTPVLSDAFVDDSAAVSGNGLPLTPYQTIQPAFVRIAEGGTINVANGNYTEQLVVKKNGTKFVGESQAGVHITPLSNTYGQGFTSEGLSSISLKNFTIDAAVTGGGGYALKLHKGSNLVLSNITLNGAGNGTNMGGVDVSGINGISLDNVNSSNFKKNGVAFSSQFDATDPFTRGVTLNNITSKNNGWAGVAFYTMNNAGTEGHTFSNVNFTGSNTISGNAKGLEIVGDSDANVALLAIPRFSITSPSNGAVNVGSTEFNANTTDIINYQVTDLNATSATFNGTLGKDLTTSGQNALNGRIFDKKDLSSLGRVLFDTEAPIITSITPASGTLHGVVSFEMTATNPNPGYSYLELNQGGTWKTDNTKPSANPALPNFGGGTSGRLTINTASYPDGTYNLKVDVIDASGNSTERIVTYVFDNTPAGVPTNGLPNGIYKTEANGWAYTWSNESASGAVKYEYQASRNSAQSSGVLTAVEWNNITNGDATQSNLTTPTIPSINTADGKWYWQVRSIDAVGNVSAWSQIWSVTVDTIAPTVPEIINPSASQYFNGTSTLNKWETSTDINGIAQYEVKYELTTGTSYRYVTAPATSRVQTFSGSYQGPITISVRAQDKAGNWSAFGASVTYYYDSIKPSDPGTPSTTTPTNSATLDWSWIASTDAVSGVKGYYYELKKGTDVVVASTFTTSSSASTIATSDGTFTLSIYAVDNAGNISGTVVGTVDVDTTPSTAPASALWLDEDGNVQGSVTNVNYVTAQWTSPSVGTVDHYEYSYLAPGASWSTPESYPVSTTNIVGQSFNAAGDAGTQGNWQFRVRTVNNFGVASDWTTSAVLNYDRKPTVTIDSYTTTGNTITPIVTASDEVSGTNLTYKWAPASNVNVTISDDTAKEPTFTVNADGTYTFVLTVEDEVGNTTSTQFVFTYTTPVTPASPVAPVTTPVAVTPTTGDGFTNVQTQEVLGETDDNTDVVAQNNASDNDSDANVAGTTDDKTSTDSSNIFGLAWYWWILILAALAAIIWWIVGAVRRRREEA